MMTTAPSISFLVIIFIAGVKSETCASAFDCSKTTLTTSHEVDCEGYGSCSNSTLNASNVIQCLGTQSCSYCDYIKYYGYLYGSGKLSLGWTDTITSSINFNGDRVQMFAEAAAYKVNILNLTFRSNLRCHGYRSCDSSRIYVSPDSDIKGFGTLSLLNAQIYAYKLQGSSYANLNGALQVSNITLDGFFAGYNATIYCPADLSCLLNCHGNGCAGTYFICDNKNRDESDTCSYICNETNNTICPLTDLNSELPQLSLGLDIEGLVLQTENYLPYFKTTEEIDCPSSTSIRCTDYQSCQNDLLLPTDDKNVCCMGYDSCETATLSMDNGGTLHCSANYCFEEIIAIVLNDAYITGAFALGYGKIVGFERLIIRSAFGSPAQTNPDYRTSISYGYYLTCDGYKSCQSANISQVENIYATGKLALHDTIIKTDGIDINIFAVGYDAAHSLTVVCSNTSNSDNTNGDSNEYSIDKCTLYCLNDGCINAANVDCCTILYSDSFNPTTSPTVAPTAPTPIPVAIPSQIPTLSPTDRPTKSPTTLASEIAQNVTLNSLVIAGLLLFGFLVTVISCLRYRSASTFAKKSYFRDYYNNSNNAQLLLTTEDGGIFGYNYNNHYNGKFSTTVTNMSDINDRDHDMNGILDYERGFGSRPSHWIMFSILLTAFDMYTDILFINDANAGGIIWAVWAFVATVLIEIILNVYFITQLWYNEMKYSKQFSLWLTNNMCWVILLTFLSIFEIKLFTTVFTSQLCGNNLFYAPLLKANIAKINKNSLWILIIVHIPQFIIQLIVVATFDNGGFTLILAVAITIIDLIYATVSSCVWRYAHKSTKSLKATML